MVVCPWPRSNTCLKHLVYFCLCHKLVETKEMEPLQRLIDRFMADDDEKRGGKK